MMEKKDAWLVYISFAQQNETSSWNRFYNFLMFTSILVVAWAALYSQSARPVTAKIVLLLISAVGFFSGITWSFLGCRSREWIDWYLKHARKIEDDKEFDDLWRVCTRTIKARDGTATPPGPSLRFGIFGSYYHQVYVPIVMALLYLVLFSISVSLFLE